MIEDVRLLDGGRRHGDASSSSPTTATCATARGSGAPGRRGSAWLLGRLGRPAARLAVDRQPATGAVRTASRFRAGAVDLARTSERRRPGRDGPSGLEARTRRDDQDGQPDDGSQGGRDW